jgi:hypothetical protein
MTSPDPQHEPTPPKPSAPDQQQSAPIDGAPDIPRQTDPTQPQPPLPPGSVPLSSGFVPRPRSARTVPLIAALLIAAGSAVVFCLGGVFVGVAGTNSAKPQVSYVPSPYPVVSTITVTQTVQVTPSAAATTAPAPPPPPPPPPSPTIQDGTWTVGTDFPAGTYRTTGAGSDCYWAITKSGTNGADIINNHIGGGNLTVTLKSGQDFETDRCGTWTKVG